MFNQLSGDVRATAIDQMTRAKFPVMSQTFDRRDDDYYNIFTTETGHAVLLYYPVFKDDILLGSITSEYGWRTYIQTSTLPPKSHLVRLVVSTSCGQQVEFQIIDGSLETFGTRQLSPPYDRFEDLVMSSTFEDYETLMRLSAGLEISNAAESSETGICQYSFKVYPTAELHSEFLSHHPRLYASFAAAMFVITIILLLLYDCFVRRRQNKLLKAAKKSTALIASLFPKAVRNQIIEDTQKRAAPQPPPSEAGTKATRRSSLLASMTSLTFDRGNASFLRDQVQEKSRPIAQLFDNTTVMFLDLAGFTAWSSEREPREVFLLLETVYQSFDDAATRRGVCKFLFVMLMLATNR